MEINSLTGKEICNIIKECARANVSKVKISDLEIEFGTKTKTVEEGTQLPLPGMETTTPQLGTIDKTKSPEIVELSDEDKEHLRLVNEAQLTLDDPVLFEEHITDELLYSEVTNEGNERRRLEQSV